MAKIKKERKKDGNSKILVFFLYSGEYQKGKLVFFNPKIMITVKGLIFFVFSLFINEFINARLLFLFLH